MYAELKTQWVEIKNCEEFTQTINGEKSTITYIHRAIVDWKRKTLYWAFEHAQPKNRDDKDWVELIIRETHGPYSTEASLKTAISKIKNKIRKSM